MSQASTDFSYFLGGLAVMSTIFSLAYGLQSYMPSNQMKILDELLLDTRQIYDKSLAGGFLPEDLKDDLGERLKGYGSWKLAFFNDQLWILITRTNFPLCSLEETQECLREQVYLALTIFDQYAGLACGLSFGIMKASKDAKRLRARVVVSSLSFVPINQPKVIRDH